MSTYIIRNDLTGRVWTASPSEARLYAIDSIFGMYHSVFRASAPNIYLIRMEIV